MILQQPMVPNDMLSILFGSVTIWETDFTGKLNMLPVFKWGYTLSKRGNIFNLLVKSVSEIVTDPNRNDNICDWAAYVGNTLSYNPFTFHLM